MSKLSAKTQERVLYFISPIGLLLLWQVLLMLGIGDRRFVPAPSDIAWRYWELVASGELAAVSGSTPVTRPFASSVVMLSSPSAEVDVIVRSSPS